MKEIDTAYESEIVKNFEQEYLKVESYKEIMVKVITEYTDNVKLKLTEQMATQRSSVNEHLKELDAKIKDIEEILGGVNLVEKRLMQI